jgi:hypothetical protein
MADIFADTAGWGHLVDPSQTYHARAAAIYRHARQQLVAYGFYQAIHLSLWRRRPLCWFLRIPDFGGRWEGWYWNTLGKEWLPTAHEVRQRSLSLAANAWGPNNWSRSVCAAILTDPHGGTPEFVWTYKTEPTTGPAVAHTGTHLLRLVTPNGAKRLEGKYFTDRPRREDNTIGQGGFIRLVWVASSLRNALDYNENWGMPKPSDIPASPDSAPGR